jgi:diguanylate cyclase (GGDEF)-like protein
MSKIIYLGEKKDFAASLESLFASYQSELIRCNDDQDIVTIAETTQPDLIILDVDHPSFDMFGAAKVLKRKRKTKTIPILFLASEQKNKDIREDCLNAGGDDCLLKPLNIRELVVHVHRIIKKANMSLKMKSDQQDGTEIRSKLLTEIEKLNQINRNLEETALIDKLTGICNRTHFEVKLREEFNRALRYDVPLALVLIDIDFFGRINDNYGHDIGDFILMKIANVLQLHTRFSDTVCKLDGADFSIIMPRTDMQNGLFEGERLRVAINQTEYIDDSLLEKNDKLKRGKRDKTEITASLGVASFPFEGTSKNETDLLNWAQKALSRAKTSGKNKTIAASEVL